MFLTGAVIEQLSKMQNFQLWIVTATMFLLACGAQPPVETTPDHAALTVDTALDEGAAVPTASSEPIETETEWLAILIDGHKSGYLQSTRTVFSDRVETEVTTAMEVRRGGESLPFLTNSKMTETPDGKPLRIEKSDRSPGMEQTESGRIEGNILHLSTRAAGRTFDRTVDWPAGALMNEGQRLEMLRYGLQKGVTYTSRYFDPDLLEAVDVEVSVGERWPLDLLGRVVEGTAVRLAMRFRGTESTLDMVLDDKLNTLSTLSSKMGMKVEMMACTEQYAKSDNDPAEIIEAAFIDAKVVLSPKRRQSPITYTVRTGGAEIIVTGEQTVSPKGEAQLVTVKKQHSSAGPEMPYRGADAAASSALAPNVWIQSDAPEIVALARTAVGDATDAHTAAFNIERFVADYIKEKNLSVGYATALETARSKEGDCTEHALLTAALCRASGIPAQVVFGLVYVEAFEKRKNLFGGHAWTRVFLDDKWVSLDAALGGFDTGHLALTISSGDPSDFFQIIDFIGDMEITAIQ